MKVVWAETARREWAGQYRFYFSRNPDATRLLRRAVMSAAQQLCTYPRRGNLGRIEQTRELVIVGTPFLLVYAENPVRIEILHVYDRHQSWTGEATA
jgi:toxin ParE1/3/4